MITTRGRGPGEHAGPADRARAARAGAGRARSPSLRAAGRPRRRPRRRGRMCWPRLGRLRRSAPASAPRSVHSTGTTASAPLGTGAPVMILTAVPGRQREQPGLAGADLADHRQVHRATPREAPATSANAHGVAVHRGVVEARQRRSARRRPRHRQAERVEQRLRRRPAAARARRGSARGARRRSGARSASGRRPWPTLPSPRRRTAPASGTRCAARVEARRRPTTCDAVAEGPVARRPQRARPPSATGRRRGSAGRSRRPACSTRRRGRRTGSRRAAWSSTKSGADVVDVASAAPAGRWSSSPARTGRGRPRSCARPRTPRSRHPSRSRSGSPRACSGRPGRRS